MLVLLIVATLKFFSGLHHILFKDTDVISSLLMIHWTLGEKHPHRTLSAIVFDTGHSVIQLYIYPFFLQTYSASIWPNYSKFVSSDYMVFDRNRESSFRWFLANVRLFSRCLIMCTLHKWKSLLCQICSNVDRETFISKWSRVSLKMCLWPGCCCWPLGEFFLARFGYPLNFLSHPRKFLSVELPMAWKVAKCVISLSNNLVLFFLH